MTKYHSHGNTLSVICAMCKDELTLRDKFPYLDKVYCEECYEVTTGEVAKEDSYEED